MPPTNNNTLSVVHASRRLSRRKRWILLILLLIILMVVGFVLYRAVPEQRYFIIRDGSTLTVKGQPYRFSGYNAPGLLGCGQERGWAINDQQREKYFASLPPGSMTRVAYYNTDRADQLERVVQTARRYGQYLTVSLADHKGQCGDTLKTDIWYNQEYTGSYTQRLTKVVNRYKDEPTVAIWEPIATPSGDPKYVEQFLTEVAGFIKRTAPQQLISSGTALPGDGNINTYMAINRITAVDIIGAADTTAAGAAGQGFKNATSAAEQLRKPLVTQWQIEAAADGIPCVHTYQERSAQAATTLNDYFSAPTTAGALYNFVAPTDTLPCSGAAQLVSLTDGLISILNSYQIPGRPVATSESAPPATASQVIVPAAPQQVHAALASSNTVVLTWKPGDDTSLVAGYNIFRNGVIIATSVSPSYTDTNLDPNANYTYRVSAYDQVGNLSADSKVLHVSTSHPQPPADSSQATAQPLALAIATITNGVPLVAGDQPTVSGTVQISNPDQKATAVARTELLINKRARSAASGPPFNLQLDTKTLTNATHELTYKIHYTDGTSNTSTRRIVASNSLTLYERVRNAALEPLAGSSGTFLNSIFGILAVVILVLPGSIIVALVRLRHVEDAVARYEQKNKWDES